MKYTEHDKLSEVREQSQFLGEFIEWAQSKGMFLAEYDHKDRVVMVNKTINTLLSEFLNIDLVKLEKEKLQMLEALKQKAV
jgi:hypothetical protein